LGVKGEQVQEASASSGRVCGKWGSAEHVGGAVGDVEAAAMVVVVPVVLVMLLVVVVVVVVVVGG
jgi:hypothetical protein